MIISYTSFSYKLQLNTNKFLPELSKKLSFLSTIFIYMFNKSILFMFLKSTFQFLCFKTIFTSSLLLKYLSSLYSLYHRYQPSGLQPFSCNKLFNQPLSHSYQLLLGPQCSLSNISLYLTDPFLKQNHLCPPNLGSLLLK